MSNDLMILKDGPLTLPAHLQGMGGGITEALMAVVGDYRNRIGLKGNRFRQIIQGQEVGVWDENYLDVVIVGVVGSLSRQFYASKYSKDGDNNPPVCYSVDNIVPAEDVISKQSDKCATCPQNIKGSRITEDGAETKACGYFRRMVVFLPGDSERTLYVIDVKAMGLFGDSKPELNMRNMIDYAKYLDSKKVDASLVVTRLSFDIDESVPKLLFKPHSFVDEYDAETVRALVGSQEVEDYLKINFKTLDLSKEAAAEEPEVAAAEEPVFVQEVFEEPEQPAVQAAPARPAPRPAQPQPAARPAQTAAPAARPAPKPAQPQPAATRPVPTPTQTRPVPAPAAKPAPAAPARPAAKPTGPGRLVTPAAAKPAAAAAVQVDTGVPAPRAAPVAMEIGGDAEMSGLMAELGL